MQNMFGKIAISDLIHIVLENMRKRRNRTLLTMANVFFSIALVSSMMMLSSSYKVQTTNLGFIPLKLSDYQIWISMISIITCTITILNSMLIAVMERYKEIGTIKCLGAKNSFIILLFITESMLIGLIGGILGYIASFIVAGIIMIIQIGTLISIQNYIQILLISILISILISLIATIFPAYYASRINPVEALRFEV